jgi:hypothetical protein
MSRKFFLIICISIFIFSCLAKDKNVYSKIIIDDKYCLMQKANDTAIPKNYQIESLNGFILDCSKYDFSFIQQLNKGKAADLIFINSKSGAFTVKLNLKGETIIDSTSMTSFTLNKKPFTGFINRETIRLGIGLINSNNGINEMVAFWSANIEIK